jgi:hypothetical protein
MEATVNNILREWRDLWPGGLKEEQYSTLNLIAHCRQGTLGYNYAKCGTCRHREWYASSCGDRHCPMCLGPRQARWSEDVCARLPDCAHFHVVYTGPREMRHFFRLNYRIAADLFFAAAAETMRLFQRNNWGVAGAFMAVLHTWGRMLNWHPHLHVLVAAGGMDPATGNWKTMRKEFLFSVKAMSRVFGAIFLRKLEEIDADPDVRWPAMLDTAEARRGWRVRMASRNWNIFIRPTLANTRAVVRYLARYTSRIAMSNQRITRVDPAKRTVSFNWKDYRNDSRNREMTMTGQAFLRSFTRHLVPKGFRRIRYFGLLTGSAGRVLSLPDAPRQAIGERATPPSRHACPRCGGFEWIYPTHHRTGFIPMGELPTPVHRALRHTLCSALRCISESYRFSLYPRPRDSKTVQSGPRD